MLHLVSPCKLIASATPRSGFILVTTSVLRATLKIATQNFLTLLSPGLNIFNNLGLGSNQHLQQYHLALTS